MEAGREFDGGVRRRAGKEMNPLTLLSEYTGARRRTTTITATQVSLTRPVISPSEFPAA